MNQDRDRNADKIQEGLKKKNQRMAVLVLTAALAAAAFTGCANERRENQLSYRQIGIDSMQAGDYEGATAAFDRALSYCVGRIGETETDICYYKAAAQYASGDTARALATYDALIAYDDKDANAYYMRGCLLLSMEESERAEADFAKAISCNPSEYELYVNIYENLSAYNLQAKGEEYLNKAFSIKGDAAQDHTWRGRIYFLLGQNDNALTELMAALEDGSVEANLVLAQVYEEQGDSQAAETSYKAYVDSGAADAAALNALAEIEMAKQDYAAALTYISQGLAAEQVTNKRELMQNQIICLEYTGDFSGALAVAQEYIACYPEDMEVQREYIFLKSRGQLAEETQQIQGEITDDAAAQTDAAGTESENQ